LIELKANRGPTGRLLKEMLREKGLLTGAVKAVVNYGYGGKTSLPCLNSRAGMLNKLQELELLAKNGVSTVPFSTDPHELAPPLFGRQLHHTRGTDIVMVACGRPNPAKRISDFYTTIIPKQREFRLWAYRGVPIGTYEKLLEYRERNGRRGRLVDVWNWQNGYAYHFVHPKDSPKELKQLGTMAVNALGLDFGAADILQGKDEKFYVLEINSAPGIEGRRQAMISLVNHIESWVKDGFPERKNDDKASRV
jgi:hypothetical protein